MKMNIKNRTVILVSGIFMMMFIGILYSWTVFSAPIAATFTQWTKGQLSIAYTMALIVFALAGVLSGLLQKKFKPGSLLLISGITFLLGFFVMGSARNLLMVYAGFGILIGFSTGFAYNVIISSVLAWYPEKPGEISGILLMVYGFSSFLINTVFSSFTPCDGSESWRRSFTVLAVCMFVIMLCGSLIIKKPEHSIAAEQDGRAAQGGREFTPKQMLRDKSLWIYFFWIIVMSAIGTTVFSQGTPLALEVVPGIASTKISMLVGMVSIFNGAGRMLYGLSYDKIGRSGTFMIGSAMTIASILLLIFALKTQAYILLLTGFALSGLSYSCVAPTNAAFIKQFYGAENYSVNFSIVNLFGIISSWVSVLAGFIYDATKSYMNIMLILLILAVIGTVAVTFIKKEGA